MNYGNPYESGISEPWPSVRGRESRVYAARSPTDRRCGGSCSSFFWPWSDVERVGLLSGDETVTLTRRVRWGVRDADAVRSADGWITVEVVVTADDAVVTFTGEERL